MIKRISCPVCRKVFAQRSENLLIIRHDKRVYELPPDAMITRVYCERCRQWYDVSDKWILTAVRGTDEPVEAGNS